MSPLFRLSLHLFMPLISEYWEEKVSRRAIQQIHTRVHKAHKEFSLHTYTNMKIAAGAGSQQPSKPLRKRHTENTTQTNTSQPNPTRTNTTQHSTPRPPTQGHIYGHSHADVARVDVDEVFEGREGLAALLPRPEHPLKHEGVRLLEEGVVHGGIFS